MSIGERVRRLRLERLLSQQDLAARAGVHKLTILRVENGLYYPQLSTIAKLAAALNVAASELVDLDELQERRGKDAA